MRIVKIADCYIDIDELLFFNLDGNILNCYTKYFELPFKISMPSPEFAKKATQALHSDFFLEIDIEKTYTFT